MLKRPESNEYSSNQAVYIEVVPEGDLIGILKQQIKDTVALLSDLTADKAGFRYAPGKWSIKEVVGHMADTERIMSYRLLRFARGDNTSLAGFDEDAYVKGASFDSSSLADLLDSLAAVRTATLALLKGITPEVFLRLGSANQSVLSVRALAYIIAGHELHHQNVLKERYLG
ncbi:DinB family protein [Paenibacillus psychroresistens]|uniref:DinB family protein n=1 Tax=Paenibacillus psychroresistens TaxID=1778678 RepID=A0A6B8RSK5_9BACL|nr:DinB family protein [Paenibacillus psychroresistens]QGQ98286.1 DinB family protein [Paenibacillus psychroresistens]